MTYFFLRHFHCPQESFTALLVTRSHAPVVNIFIGSNYVDDDGQNKITKR